MSEKSDAKAKAEARRAKILAKEGSRLQLAKGETSSLKEGSSKDIDEPIEEVRKDRPLAARRKLVNSNKEKSDNNVSNYMLEGNVGEESLIEDTDKLGIDHLAQQVADVVKPKTFTPPAVREVEKEVATNTAKFDQSMLDKSNSGISSNEMKPTTSASAKKKILANSLRQNSIQGPQIMKILRLVLIFLTAFATGYYVATSSANDSVLSSSSAWVIKKIESQFHCTLSALGIIWWSTSLLQPSIYRLFPKKKSESGDNILGYLYSIYNDGFTSVVDYFLEVIGEICLHFTVAITSYMIVVYLLENGAPTTADFHLFVDRLQIDMRNCYESMIMSIEQLKNILSAGKESISAMIK